jgi:hypothetical protein
MHVKEIKFQNFSGYLNYMGYYAGYGGMDWNDMYEVQNAFISEQSWCDTGYNNVLHGNGEAITLGDGGFQSDNLARSFTLEKGVFASAWESNQPVYFNSYTYTSGQGFALKASDLVTLGQNAYTINFGHYGSDFKDIAKITFTSGVGEGGNTCSYGTPTYGYILVMDDLQLKWAGGHGNARAPHLVSSGLQGTHHGMPHLEASFSPLHPHGSHLAGAADTSHGAADSSYHSQAAAQSGHDVGGMDAQFTLPQVEHFGM